VRAVFVSVTKISLAQVACICTYFHECVYECYHVHGVHVHLHGICNWIRTHMSYYDIRRYLARRAPPRPSPWQTLAFVHQYLGYTDNPVLAPIAHERCLCRRYFLWLSSHLSPRGGGEREREAVHAGSA
jgi:hypothetical protein